MRLVGTLIEKTARICELSLPKPFHTSISHKAHENNVALMRIKGTVSNTNFKGFMRTKFNKKRGNQKGKLNITLREEARQKLAALAELEKRSVSNLIEVMADARWEELADREGIDYAKTVAEIAGLNGLSADKEADRKAFRREILERVLKYKKR